MSHQHKDSKHLVEDSKDLHSRVPEIIPLRHVRLVNKPFLVHYDNTSSLCEYNKTIKQSIQAVLLFVMQGGDKIYCITCICCNTECVILKCHMMPWLLAATQKRIVILQ